MIKYSIIIIVISFLLCTTLCKILIPVLHRFKFGQEVRDDGPKAHLVKSGTATMGGIMIILSIVISLTPYVFIYKDLVFTLIFIISFSFIGFLDDYLKIKKKKSEGLSVKQKLILQIIFALIFILYIYKNQNLNLGLLIPFTGSLKNGIIIKIGVFFVPFSLLFILGTDNGVNFTDGLDGLCSSVTIIVAMFFMVFSLRENNPLSLLSAAVIGSLLGFLIFNSHPAKIFMGDTGSLALGAYVSATALLLSLPLFIFLVGFIYFIEALSVILQVSYFRLTKGKRIFKMAPIHHHFELCSYQETKILTAFTIITIILSLLSLYGVLK